MTLPTTHHQTTANANADTKKCHGQEDNQEDDVADGINAGDGVGAINGDKPVNKAMDDIKAINTSEAAKANNLVTEVEAIKAIKNAKSNINCYPTALIHNLNVHEDAKDATITAENT